MVSTYEASSQPNLVIVGGGMAGSKLAHDVHALGLNYQVTLISEEEQVGYNRIMLSALLAKDISKEDMPLVDVTKMANAGVRVVAGDPAVILDVNLRTITLASGTQIQYDKLVLATGSRSSILPLEGSDAKNVIGFRNWQDTEMLTELCSSLHVSVIGGGLLGLEAAVGLAKKGHKVTVYHRSEWLLNRQLDSTAAHLLQAKLESYGVDFKLSTSPNRLLQDGSGEVVAIECDDHTQPTDLVVMAAGITPEITLAERAGIATSRAITVDPQMRTSHTDVYALGECCEFESQTFGLVAPIWDQIKVLLQVLNDKTSTFQIEAVPTKLKVSGVDLFSVGKISPDTGDVCICYTDISTNHYRKLMVNDGQLVGAILYGNVADGSWYFQLIQNKTDVSCWLDTLIFGEAYCRQNAA
ncbi:NAD(P)/FAD-dependent oxidoreductase [Marinomonas piezotolerans]|uniref:NAD(P)/FAD-dependent oxidoreductase n=1 Tax=Marinomonas piezotolerans TaxID=2213058 RepID=A0A370UDZ6_9GAMM|nr:FAD-dependent oxidoreductase [Marinomonas piezotolerans]RDL46004.1 NAD(P)/FAD-dependent oxidoreductase [Marinomonas piezotolerans]